MDADELNAYLDEVLVGGRASPADRDEYEQLKRRLAERDWEDVNHYAAAKGPLVEEILRRG